MKTKISYHLWDEADTVNGISSMGRVTGYSRRDRRGDDRQAA